MRPLLTWQNKSIPKAMGDQVCGRELRLTITAANGDGQHPGPTSCQRTDSRHQLNWLFRHSFEWRALSALAVRMRAVGHWVYCVRGLPIPTPVLLLRHLRKVGDDHDIIRLRQARCGGCRASAGRLHPPGRQNPTGRCRRAPRTAGVRRQLRLGDGQFHRHRQSGRDHRVRAGGRSRRSGFRAGIGGPPVCWRRCCM
jgi:hypothetical protein